MQDDEKILYLIRGLKSSIQQQVIMSDSKKCKDLLDHAKREEAAAVITQPSSTITSSTINEHIDETTAALRRTNINQNNRSSDHSTWNHQRDFNRRRSQQHYNTNYNTNRFRQHTSSQLQCYNCNGFGHYV